MSAPTITPAPPRGANAEVLVNGDWVHVLVLDGGVVQPDHGHPFRLTPDFEVRVLPKTVPSYWCSLKAAAVKLRITEMQVLRLAVDDHRIAYRFVDNHYEVARSSLARFIAGGAL
jgi:hypothetical protein